MKQTENEVNPSDFHPDQPIDKRLSSEVKESKNHHKPMSFYKDKVSEMWASYDTEMEGELDKIETSNFAFEIATAMGQSFDMHSFSDFYKSYCLKLG